MQSEIFNFIDTAIAANKRFNSGEWFELDQIKIYLRYTPQRSINGKMQTTIDIASVGVLPEFQGTGLFTNILTSIETRYPNIPIFVESIINDKFYDWFIKRGYKPVINTNDCVILERENNT